MPTKYWSVALTCTQVSQLHYTSIATILHVFTILFFLPADSIAHCS